MSVSAEHLIEGGTVYFRQQLARPGAASEVRLKPAKVIEVDDTAARIQLLDEQRPRYVRFALLEPDVDYLASRLRSREQPKSNVVELRAPPAANEQAPAEPPSSSSSSSSTEKPDSYAPTLADVKGFLELGQELRTKLDEQILKAPYEDVGRLMAQRSELDTHLAETAQKSANEGNKDMAHKKHTPYTETQRKAVLASLGVGMSSKEAAAKHSVAYWTVRDWSKAAYGKGKGGRKPSVPAPIVATPSKQRAVVARVSKVPVKTERAPVKSASVTKDRAPVKTEASGPYEGMAELAKAVSQQENRRLRAVLAVLLERKAGDDTAQLSEQNRQLQAVIDLLLGIE